jgi:hypothetical protein
VAAFKALPPSKKSKKQQAAAAAYLANQPRLSFSSASTALQKQHQPLTTEEEQELTLELFSIIVEADISFRSLTESPAYRRQMQRLAGWTVPSRNFLKRALPEYYDVCMRGLRAELSTVDCISITTDSTFLTRHGTPYIAITAHFIDNAWKLHDRPLAIFPAQQSETAEYITTQLKAILQRDFNLNNKVHCIVTDEGQNFLRAAENVQRLDVVRERIRCACHRFQLAFKEGVVQKKKKIAAQRDTTLLHLIKNVRLLFSYSRTVGRVRRKTC